jgi:hypothetical protein
MKALYFSLASVTVGALTFGAICFVFDMGSLDHTIFAAIVGAFTGLLAAPELDPESFSYPKTIQVSSGIGAGVGIGLFFQVSLPYFIVLVCLGALTGYFAKQVVDNVPVP